MLTLLEDLLSSLAAYTPRDPFRTSRLFDDVLRGYDIALAACGERGEWDTALRLLGERREVAAQAGRGAEGSVGLQHVLRAMGRAGQVR